MRNLKTRLAAGAAGLALVAAGLFVAAVPAHADTRSVGYQSCANSVYVWSSSTGNTTQWLSGVGTGHWNNGATYTFRQSTRGLAAEASWQAVAPAFAYAYPKCT